jgi:HlyD family secretion protein
MKRRVLIIIAVIVVVIALAAILKIGPFKQTDAAYRFETVKVEKGKITNTVTATGTIEAITSVNVGTQVSGIIQKVYVDFNDNVKQGQLLAKLDETSLRAQLEQSQSTVDQAQAELTYQESTYTRLKALYEKKLIAQTDYDQALYNYQRSKAALANARSAYDRTKVNLDYATIFSPIDGVVLNRAVEEGQTVAASFNTPTLFTIVNDLTQMEVQTSVDEADIGKVKVNQRIEFTVDAYPDDKFEGSVSELRLQPVTTNNVVTYVVILTAPNPDKKLMPGMTASATIYVEEKDNTLFVAGKALRFTPDPTYLAGLSTGLSTDQKNMPHGSAQASQPIPPEAIAQNIPEGISSVKSDLSKATVWVKDNNGGIRPMPVTTGIDNGTNIEILSGLKEGDETVFVMTGGPVKAATTSTQRSGGMFQRP